MAARPLKGITVEIDGSTTGDSITAQLQGAFLML